MVESWKCSNCGHEIQRPVHPVYCKCGKVDRRKYEQQDPSWVRLVSYFKAAEDTGIGDTVQRYAAMLGGELFKQWSKRLGLPCQCVQRQAEWNARWPYKDAIEPSK